MSEPRPLLSAYPVAPWCELGIGDTRAPAGQARWDVSRWDHADARWAGTEPTWTDRSCEVTDAHASRGRERMIDRFSPATSDVVFRNVDGWADLTAAPADPATLTLRPGRQLRWGVTTPAGRHVIYRGYIDEAVPVYEPYGTDVVACNMIDALTEAGRQQLEALEVAVGDGETADVRIARILDTGGWPTTYRSIDRTGIALQGTEFGAAAVDLIGEAAESAGGTVFGDLAGRVAFRARDWQTYLPDTPPAATIGNVGAGTPGYWIPAVPAVPGYVTPTVGVVTTPDPAPPPTQCCWVTKHRGPTAGTLWQTLAGQFDPEGQRSFWTGRNQADGQYRWQSTATGLNANAVTRLLTPITPITLGDEEQAFSVDNAGTQTVLQRWQRDAAGIWQRLGTAQTGTKVVPWDSTSVLAIGDIRAAVTAQRWNGRIYSVELRTGLDPAAGTVIWRFDADDYPGTGTTYVDPRGRTWTLTNAAAITPKIPEVPAVWVPAVPADVCPSTWELAFRRRDVTAYARMGRADGVFRAVSDPAAAAAIGPEPFVRDDLVTADADILELLATRALETRGLATMPRVEAVTLDAARDPGDGSLVELMATAAPETPTRLRCRLTTRDGRAVFDVEMFVTGVEHTITATGRWFARFTLDVAAPYAAPGGRWDQARWDRATWAVAV